MREWKPGDVAKFGSFIAMRTVKGWAYSDGSDGGLHQDAVLARPLVVIDPEDREQVKRLVTPLVTWIHEQRWGVAGRKNAIASEVDHMQAALRSLLTPPKPDEPTGLGAVVEDAEGRHWVRFAGDDSPARWCYPSAFPQRWSDLTPVRILSEGVTP